HPRLALHLHATRLAGHRLFHLQEENPAAFRHVVVDTPTGLSETPFPGPRGPGCLAGPGNWPGAGGCAARIGRAAIRHRRLYRTVCSARRCRRKGWNMGQTRTLAGYAPSEILRTCARPRCPPAQDSRRELICDIQHPSFLSMYRKIAHVVGIALFIVLTIYAVRSQPISPQQIDPHLLIVSCLLAAASVVFQSGVVYVLLPALSL